MGGESREGNLIRHGESFVICCWTDDVDYRRKDNQIQNIQPSVEKEPTISLSYTPRCGPSRLPILRRKVISSTLRKRRDIQEKERKQHQDTPQKQSPNPFIHRHLDSLFSLRKISDRAIKRGNDPHVEGRGCCGQGDDDEENPGRGGFGGY